MSPLELVHSGLLGSSHRFCSTDPTLGRAPRNAGLHSLPAGLTLTTPVPVQLNLLLPRAMGLADMIVWLLGVILGLLRRLLPARLLAAARPAVAALQWALQITTPAGIAGTLRMGQEMANRQGCDVAASAASMACHVVFGVMSTHHSHPRHEVAPPISLPTWQGAPDAGTVCHAGAGAARGATAATSEWAAAAGGRLPAGSAGQAPRREPAQVRPSCTFCPCLKCRNAFIQSSAACVLPAAVPSCNVPCRAAPCHAMPCHADAYRETCMPCHTCQALQCMSVLLSKCLSHAMPRHAITPSLCAPRPHNWPS